MADGRAKRGFSEPRSVPSMTDKSKNKVIYYSLLRTLWRYKFACHHPVGKARQVIRAKIAPLVSVVPEGKMM